MGGKRRTTHQWTVDNPEGNGPPPAERRDAVQNKTEKKALDTLTRRLLALPPPKRAKLDLDDDLLEELELLERQGPKSSRRRQMLRLQGLLRSVDVDALNAQLDDDGGSADARLERWRQVLIGGGDAELQAFLDEHPDADRQQLRSLARQARGETPAARRAFKRLYQAIKAATPVEAD